MGERFCWDNICLTQAATIFEPLRHPDKERNFALLGGGDGIWCAVQVKSSLAQRLIVIRHIYHGHVCIHGVELRNQVIQNEIRVSKLGQT